MSDRTVVKIITSVAFSLLFTYLFSGFSLFYLPVGWFLGAWAANMLNLQDPSDKDLRFAKIWFHAAVADGAVSENEKECLRRLLVAQGTLDASNTYAEYERLLQFIKRTRGLPGEFNEWLMQLSERGQMISLYGICAVIYSDGEASSIERKFLRDVINALENHKVAHDILVSVTLKTY